MGAPIFVLLMALTGQRFHFFIHHQVHQCQPGLP
jgi:hypothetical protein